VKKKKNPKRKKRTSFLSFLASKFLRLSFPFLSFLSISFYFYSFDSFLLFLLFSFSVERMGDDSMEPHGQTSPLSTVTQQLSWQ